MRDDMTQLIRTPHGTFDCPTYSVGMFNKLRTTGGFELPKLRQFFLWTRKHYPGPRKGVFVDIGANIGTTVIPALGSPMVTRGIAVEPAPFVFKCLERSINASKVQNRVKAIHGACGAFDGETSLKLCPNNCGDNRLDHEVNKGFPWHTVRVPMMTLDSIWEREGLAEPPAFIWIDAQGAEPGILAGTQFRNDPRVPFFIEFFPPGLQDPEGFFKLLEANWSAFIDAKDRKRYPVDNARTMFAQMMKKKNAGTHTDLFMIR